MQRMYSRWRNGFIRMQPLKRSCHNNPQTKTDEILEKVWVSAMFCGGVVGGSYAGYLTYRETRKRPYNECIAGTTAMTFYGLAIGIAAGVLFPILVPVASTVALIRYFDVPHHPEPIRITRETTYEGRKN